MKEVVTKVIEMLTQKDFHGASQKCIISKGIPKGTAFLGTYKKKGEQKWGPSRNKMVNIF